MSGSSPPPNPNSPAPRGPRATVPLAILGAASVAFAVLLFQVIRAFSLPLFLAAVFATMTMPLQERLAERCHGRAGLTALLITLALLLLLVGPTTAAFVASYGRALDAVSLLDRSARETGVHEHVVERLARLTHTDPRELRARGVELFRDAEELLFRRAIQAVGNVFSFGVSVCIFLVACFFFLKDGRAIIRAWEELTPLDVENDRKIRREFAVVCRAVVSSTFLAALAQAVAFGVVLTLFNVAFGLELGRWLAPLTLLVLVFAMIPLLGAPVVWVPLTAWLLYREDYAAGLLLALIGAFGIGSLDNLVRMFALRGSTGLHPLLALVSVLGGIQWMGVVGAFIGPVVAGVFTTLLRIFKQQLRRYTTPPPGLAPAQGVMPEAMTAPGDRAS